MLQSLNQADYMSFKAIKKLNVQNIQTSVDTECVLAPLFAIFIWILIKKWTVTTRFSLYHIFEYTESGFMCHVIK